jgi:hypothetical protein
MSFSFTPLSDDQINAQSESFLLPEGDYPFEVKEAAHQYSANGNAMIKLRIKVNEDRHLFDYLVATEKMMFKLKHFCESVGMSEEYKKGNFLVNGCIGRMGKVRIGIEKGKAKADGSGFYSPKNTVKDYVVDPQNAPDFKDDDIAF